MMVSFAGKQTLDTYEDLCDQLPYDSAVGEMIGTFLCINILNLAIKNMGITSSNAISLVLGTIFISNIFLKRRRLFRSNVLLTLISNELVFAFLLMITCLRFKQSTGEILSRCIYTVVFCVPLYTLAKKVKSINVLVSASAGPSKFVILVATIEALYLHFHPAEAIYNMPLGYALLYPTAVFWTRRKKGNINLVFMLWGLSVMLLIGSRGPLLGLLVLFALSELSDWHTAKELAKKIILLLVFIIFALFFDKIILVILSILKVFNIQSRSLQMIANGMIVSDSGRNEVFAEALHAINRFPWIGYGLSGDIPAMGGYPHNIFLEILMDFGYPMGLTICILLSIRIISNLKHNNTSERQAYYIFVACGFIPLLLSNTFLQAPFMWILFGLCRSRYIRFRL